MPKHSPPKIIIMLLVLLLTVVCLPWQCWAAGPTAAEYGVVLNLAGKQRMLTQKMSKEVLLIALDVEAAQNVDNLANSAALFNKTIYGLRDGEASLALPATSNAEIIAQLNKIIEMWEGFSQTIQTIVTAKAGGKAQVATVIDTNVALLGEMNECVKMYEADASQAGMKSNPGLAVTINLAGKQRMLSQKMSKEFLTIAYGYRVQENKQDLLKTFSLFDRTLKGLTYGNTALALPATKVPAIMAQLGVVAAIWREFKPAIIFAISDRTKEIYPAQIDTVASKNIPLLTEMNTAVGMYEREAAQ